MQQSKMHAPWREFINSDEEQRLNQLDGRISRRKKSLDEDMTERQKIMGRAIRRMRRSVGKT